MRMLGLAGALALTSAIQIQAARSSRIKVRTSEPSQVGLTEVRATQEAVARFQSEDGLQPTRTQEACANFRTSTIAGAIMGACLGLALGLYAGRPICREPLSEEQDEPAEPWLPSLSGTQEGAPVEVRPVSGWELKHIKTLLRAMVGCLCLGLLLGAIAGKLAGMAIGESGPACGLQTGGFRNYSPPPAYTLSSSPQNKVPQTGEDQMSPTPQDTRPVSKEDVTQLMNGQKEATLQDGITYLCCCLPENLSVTCELLEKPGWFRSCGQILTGSHSWNNDKFYQRPVCLVPSEKLPAAALPSAEAVLVPVPVVEPPKDETDEQPNVPKPSPVKPVVPPEKHETEGQQTEAPVEVIPNGNAGEGVVDSVWPSIAEYESFLDVRDINQNLHDVARIGSKVAAGLQDVHKSAWAQELKSKFGLTAFLHRPASELPQKMKQPYYAGKPLEGTKVAVIGAGPGGLRFAVEAALLGAEVHVIESRDKFNRFNVLKLWEYSMQDLVSVGVKDLYSELKSFLVKRVPICVLQHTLLRIALSLGVTIHPSCALSKLTCPDASKGPELNFRISSRSACPSQDQIKATQFHAIFDATGSRGALRESPCYGDEHLIEKRVKPGAESIGVTMNFRRYPAFAKPPLPCLAGRCDRSLYDETKDKPEFKELNPAKDDTSNLSIQYAMELFKSKLVKITNWVYWKSAITHYVVLTIPRASLVEHRVVPEASASLPLADLLKTVDMDKLVEIGLLIAREWNFPHDTEDPKVAFVDNFAGKPDIAIFDYSGKTTAMAAARIVPGQVPGEDMLLGLLGDAIETPFWPMGTGANHAIYLAQTQALVLLDWRLGGATVEMSNKLMSQVLQLPITGSKLNFKQADYKRQIAENYKSVEKGEMPLISN